MSCDGEPGRHGKAGLGHCTQTGALATDDRLIRLLVIVEEDGVVRHYHDTPSYASQQRRVASAPAKYAARAERRLASVSR